MRIGLQVPNFTWPGGPQALAGTLATIARTDACNLFAAMGDDVLRAKLNVLKRHCDTVGRDYAAIEKTVLGTVMLAPGRQSAADVIALCRSLADRGIQHAIFNMPNVHEIAPLEIFARDVIPAVAGL